MAEYLEKSSNPRLVFTSLVMSEVINHRENARNCTVPGMRWKTESKNNISAFRRKDQYSIVAFESASVWLSSLAHIKLEYPFETDDTD